MDPVAEVLHRLLQEQVEPGVISFCEENRFAGVAAKDYVVNDARIVNAR